MSMEERHQAILEIMAREGHITNHEIQQRFQVSYDSAKRDLQLLEKKGLLWRTHGGAIMMRETNPDAQKYEEGKKTSTRLEKDRHLSIAKRAVAEIGSQEVIYVAAAGIGDLMAQNMPDDRIFTVVTNSSTVARKLRAKGNITVFLAGGEMGADGSSHDGFSVEILKRLYFDKCFITSDGISPGFGLSVQETGQPELLNTMIRNSRKVYGLYPAKKVGTDAAICVCGAKNLDVLITDEEVLEEELQGFRDVGVEVMIGGNER